MNLRDVERKVKIRNKGDISFNCSIVSSLTVKNSIIAAAAIDKKRNNLIPLHRFFLLNSFFVNFYVPQF